ncbi:tetratricopeptide repeat protein [Salipaludibacillus daqingensis]|uniref:tetratricopeptide repeat protein n=1 Tax=Salipaludibacillus daqingensis TaxID=3041001 RepID=UPI0024731D99|nr:tetratricopeptide repeat protein [Salipaludibacillus daqingensis]
MENQANGHNNVILFPGLVAKLVEKGMSSLKGKKYYDALTYFKQSTELEPKHPQARYGLVITNIEINQLEEAKKHCESMLNEGIGEYYDILQVYVSLLVQLGLHQEVVDLLEVVIAEEKLPPQMAESFFHLLEFSRQMTDEYQEKGANEGLGINGNSIKIVPSRKELIEALEKGDPDQQWGAIQQLSQYGSQVVEDASREFLKGKDNQPVLKSYLLQTLKELNVQGEFEVHKFGESFFIKIEDLESVFHRKFGTVVLRRLEQVLGQENPSMFEMMQQVWWHYLFAIFPKSPEPIKAEVWACALHQLGLHLLEGSNNPDKIIHKYETELTEVETALSNLKEIESVLYPKE